MEKEQEIHASFAVAPQTTEVMATVVDKRLVKMEKTVNFYNKIFWETETTYNNLYYSILL